MPNPSIVLASLDDEKLKQSITNLVAHVKRATHTMLTDTNSTVDAMEKKIKSLGKLKIDSGGSTDGGATKRTKAQSAETVAVKESTQAHKEKTLTLDQQASAVNTAIQSERKYTEEIRKQAAAIRATKEWQEKGWVMIGDNRFFDRDRANATKRERENMLTLEERLIQLQQQEAQAALAAAEAKRQQAQAAKEAAQADSKTKTLYNYDYTKSVARAGQIGTTNAQQVNYLKTQIADLLGVQEREVQMINVQKATYGELSSYIKQLQTAYKNLGNDIAGRHGKDIADELQRAQRELQKYQAQMSRPTSLKAAMGLSEKTLDDIAYKMRQLASYRSGLDVSTQRGEISQVNAEYDRLKKKMDEVMQKNSKMIASNTALGRSWNYMKNRLAFYFTVGASTQFVKNLIEVRSQYEMNERALGVLIDSAERGTQIFNELSQMALVSPYTLIELSTAAKQLTAYDVAAKDVVDTTRRLADMTAAVGIPVERLTYALGQIKAYGYLNARDARMFSNAGIPLVKQLSEYYSELEGRLVSTADVYDRIKKKSIDYDEVMNVIMKMTDEGGKFFDFQAKMAETLKVQLANLTLAWNNMLNEIGKSNQGLLSGGIVALKTLFLHWKDIDKIIYDVAISFGVLYAAMALSNLMFGKGTLAAIKNVAAMEGVTAANYKSVLSTAKLKASQAQFLVALNKTNVALRAQMVMMRTLSLAQAESAAKANILKTAWLGVFAAMETASAGIAAIGAAIASIAPQIAIFAAIGAIVDFGQTIKERADAIKEYNETLVRNTKESVDSINKYFGSLLYKNASELSIGDQEKAWERVREEIELSSAASELYLSTLVSGNSESERINNANNLLKKISEIRGLMTEWHKEDIKITQDFHVLGIGGDGLTRDLNDFLDSYHKALESSKDGVSININETNGLAESWERVVRSISEYGEFFSHGANIPIIKQISEAVSAIAPPAWMQKYLFGGELWGLEFKGLLSSNKASAQIDMNELNDEVDEFVVSLKERLDRSKVDDPLKIREALQESLKSAGYTGEQLEVLSIISAKKLRNLYQDTYESMSEEGKAEFDKFLSSESTSVEAFFNFVKHRNASLLSGITNEELANGKWLTNERKKWLQTYLDEFLKTHAYAYDDLANMVNNMNKLTVYIPVFFQMAQTPSDVARDYESRTGIRFSTNPVVKDAKSQVEIIDKLKKAQEDAQKKYEAAQKAGGAYWENNKKTLKEENEALITQIHSYNALTKAEESANKKGSKSGGGSKKDQLLDALKQEISLVEKLQGDYDKLTKSSASQAEALETIRGAYGKTIRLLNVQLGKYGLPQLDISQLITSKDPNKALAHFKQTLNTLVSKGLLTLERSKELEAVVEKFTLSAKTYNLDKITKGLNNELGKLKDEYELAVELDANPELGDMFADMFGINTSTLPQTFSEALDRAQIIINRKLAEMKISTPFDLMQSNIDDFAKSTGLDMESPVIKELVSAQNAYRDMFKKNITETEKVLDDYIKKYGDYSDKIAEIEAGRLEKLKKLNEAYYTEEMRKRPEYVAKLNAIEQGASKEKQQVDFDEFKNSRYYTMMFENLDYISTKTIRDMRDRVRELMDTMNDLTPEQLKTLISQYEKLEQKLVKRSPFKTLTNDLKEYFSTSKERKAANQEFKNAQKEYDAQKKTVAALKEKYEQAKANSNTSQSYLDFLQIEIGSENEILQILKQQLDAAQKKADKYNLTAKLAKSEAAEVAKVVASNLASLGELRDNLQDSFGIEFSDDINNVIDGLSKVGDGINKITSSASSGDVVGMLSGIVTVVKGFGDAIFGGKTDYFTSLKEELDGLIEIMEKVANYQLEALGKMTGSRAAAEYRKLLQNNQKIVDSYRELAVAAGRSGSSAGSHSYAYRTNSSLKKDWEDISKYAGETVKTVQDMYNLEPEQLKNIMTNMPLAWARIEEDIRIALEGIIEYGDKVNEYTEKFGVALTNISLDDLTGDFEGMLQEMDNSTENFAENFEEYMRNAIIRSMMVGTYNTELEAWYENFKKRIEDDELSDEDVRRLREEYMDIVNRALADRDRLTSVIGETANQANLSNLQQGISQISETTANALEAYMNGVSQQVYYHSSLLEQIRDSVVGLNLDVSLGVQSQMLLQLQNSYQTQQAIQQILEGVLVPSGRAFAVELLS